MSYTCASALIIVFGRSVKIVLQHERVSPGLPVAYLTGYCQVDRCRMDRLDSRHCLCPVADFRELRVGARIVDVEHASSSGSIMQFPTRIECVCLFTGVSRVVDGT
jgi:hypothetical protein